jgi:predicted lipase
MAAVSPTLEELRKENPGYRIVCCGHSLGAGGMWNARDAQAICFERMQSLGRYGIILRFMAPHSMCMLNE